MKISLKQLKKYIDIDLNADEISSMLTACGLEVENVEYFETIKGGLRGLVVGEVMDKQKHPGADRLSITKVNVGKPELLQIVCGAANVAAGQKVLVALPGTKLFPTFGDSFEIKKSKIRGEISEGMICSEDEVGIGNSHDGIMVLDASAVPGTEASHYFEVENDTVFEIGLTPNRADAASHTGVARDLCAVINTKKDFDNNFKHEKISVKLPDISLFKSEKKENRISVAVEDSAACPRYSGLVISGISVKESPAWLKNSLLAIGLNPINNIVDITNFVLHETGQPLHAFDIAKIAGNKIVVKKLKKETPFTTLDGTERKLTGNELMICNADEPICIAGVFGGLNSGISEATKEIFLESAFFNPSDIRKAAKQHGLKTDASFRFERGTDINNTVYALKRAALLIKEIAGGEISSDCIDIYPSEIKPAEVFLDINNFNKLSGLSLSKDDIKKILINSGIIVSGQSETGITVYIPTAKNDVKRQADLAEEILRIYGFEHIPVPEKINLSLSNSKNEIITGVQKKVSSFLTANGFFEILNNSLSSSAYNSGCNSEISSNEIKILNPLSNELDVLRTSLLFSSLKTLQYNINRKSTDLKLFEFGKVYIYAGKFSEENHLSITVSGNRHNENWQKQNKPVSFYFLKSVIENVVSCFAKIENHLIHYDNTDDTIFSLALDVSYNHKSIGKAGMIKRAVTQHFDIQEETFYAELNVDALMKLENYSALKVIEIPKFPEVRRDVSMIVNAETKYIDIRNIAFQVEKKLLRSVNIFDVYEGDSIGPGKKSYALSFILRDDEKTLEDKQIDSVMNKLIQAFESKTGAVVRR